MHLLKIEEFDRIFKIMESIFNETVLRYLKNVPLFIWTLFAGLLEWITPRNWKAKDVSQDIVLITGAGSGLGREISLEYARLGSSLILWDINNAGLQETKNMVEAQYASDKKDDSRQSCLTYIVDVADRNEIQRCSNQVLKDLNKNRTAEEPERYVSVLVNNAGIYYGLLLQELKDEQIEKIFNINILAHFWTVRAFLPKMIEHEKGHIVEIASMGGICGMLKQVDYCATKFATGKSHTGLIQILFE